MNLMVCSGATCLAPVNSCRERPAPAPSRTRESDILVVGKVSARTSGMVQFHRRVSAIHRSLTGLFAAFFDRHEFVDEFDDFSRRHVIPFGCVLTSPFLWG